MKTSTLMEIIVERSGKKHEQLNEYTDLNSAMKKGNSM